MACNTNINLDELEVECQKYISFMEKLHEPHKSNLKVTLEPFFVYSYLSILKGKRFDGVHKFFKRFIKEFLSIEGFKKHLFEILQIKTLYEAKQNQYFQRFCRHNYKIKIPKKSFLLLLAHLQKEECMALYVLLLRLVGAVQPNCEHYSKRNAAPPTLESYQTNESITHWIQNLGTSSSLKNMDNTEHSAVQNNTTCSQAIAGPSTVRNNGKISELTATASCFKTRESESTNQWTQNPGISSLLRNTGDQNYSNFSQSSEFPSIVIGNASKLETNTAASSFQRKESPNHWIESLGTSSILRSPDVKTNCYNVSMLHCIVAYGEFEINCADINQENTHFACGFENSTICVGTLDLETIGPEVIFGNETLCKSGNSKDSGTPEHFCTTTFGLDHCLTGHSDTITGLSFASSGLLMSCSDDTTARAWRLSDCESVCVYRDHEDQIRDIAVSANNLYFGTASIDCTARLWDFTHSSALINFPHPYEVELLRFDPHCRYLAAVSARRIIQLWTIEDGCLLWTIPHNDLSYITCLTISPDGKHIAYADEMGNINIWDLSSRQLYSKGAAHKKAIYDLAYNGDSSVIVSCAGDRFIRLWDAKKSLLPVPNKRNNWMHEKLAKYFAAAFDPCYLRFLKEDFLISISSKLRSKAS